MSCCYEELHQVGDRFATHPADVQQSGRAAQALGLDPHDIQRYCVLSPAACTVAECSGAMQQFNMPHPQRRLLHAGW